jgi:WD40 repeat protein
VYLVRYDLASGRHEIEDCIPTRFGEHDVSTDLLDGDNRGRFATSNCTHGSVSIYRLKKNRLEFERDLPIPEKEPGFCHGVKFVPDGEILCATTTMQATSVYFLHVASGEIVYKFRDGDWRPKDVCFLDDSRIIVIYTQGTPSFGEATPYDSKASLIALDLGARRHEVIREFMISGHVDCCRRLGRRVYITNGSRDCVMILRLEGNTLTLDRELRGYYFPHGIDVLPGLLAVTNYGSNTIVLSKLTSVAGSERQGPSA